MSHISSDLKKYIGFIFGPNRNLNLMIRFNTRQRSYNETVASHIYYVAFYSMMLAEILNENGYKVNISDVMKKALVHDIEESTSGDIVRTFKLKMKDAYNEFAKISVSQVLNYLPDTITQKYMKIWENKDTSLETLIVEIADELTGIIYCCEQRKMGNKFFESILGGYRRKLSKLLERFPVKSFEYELQCFIDRYDEHDYNTIK